MTKDEIEQANRHLKTIQGAVDALGEIGGGEIAYSLRQLNEAAQELESSLFNAEPEAAQDEPDGFEDYLELKRLETSIAHAGAF